VLAWIAHSAQVARAILAWLKLHKRHILNGPTSLELAMSKLQTQACTYV
jgi:hypothetical protein